MEVLPVEIADKILSLIFYGNSRGLYDLRRVSKTWRDMVDRCTARLLKVWSKKCSDEIPESCLDDFVRLRLQKSWQKYCSYKLAVPHIAKEIYESRNEFPNLDGNLHFTEIWTHPEIEKISSYAVNDKYFAIGFSMLQGEETKSFVRIYSLDDLTYCLRECPIRCIEMDFYATDNREFIVLRKKDGGSKSLIFVVEFLVNGNLIPANLPLDDDSYYFDILTYVITKNECFTISNDSNGFQHQELTENGFESSTDVRVPLPDGSKFAKITNIQICKSNLFVFVCYRRNDRKYAIGVYKYRMIRQPNGKLIFSNPIAYQKKSSAKHLRIYLGSDNISLWSSICDVYPYKLDKWVKDFFSEWWTKVHSVTIYTHHVLITCRDKLIVFRGSLRQLMDNIAKNADPESTCTEIDLESYNLRSSYNSDYARVIHFECKPQFLIVTSRKVFMVNFIP